VSQEPSRWLDRLVSACFSVLLGALALYGAVWLLRAVWVVLVIGGVVVTITGLMFLALRGRSRGW
jgi:hypothetical protein